MWIGGNDGKLYMFTINENLEGITKYSATLLKKKTVAVKKGITNLQVDPPHKKLFALVDSTVCVYDMTTLTHLEVGFSIYYLNRITNNERHWKQQEEQLVMLSIRTSLTS